MLSTAKSIELTPPLVFPPPVPLAKILNLSLEAGPSPEIGTVPEPVDIPKLTVLKSLAVYLKQILLEVITPVIVP